MWVDKGGRNSGGYNGGGNGQNIAGSVSPSGYGGGGATHISIMSGELKQIKIDDVYIIAGAGGGAVEDNVSGGNAGGYQGNSGTGSCFIARGSGYYGGGGSSYLSSKSCGGGGGGSGYIGNVLLTNKSMYCYNCTESTAESTQASGRLHPTQSIPPDQDRQLPASSNR